jgi:hypothetical protein
MIDYTKEEEFKMAALQSAINILPKDHNQVVVEKLLDDAKKIFNFLKKDIEKDIIQKEE